MHNLSDNMRRCIDTCLNCYKICFGTAMTHCLQKGGKHTEPAHFSLMITCAETCRTSAHAMLSGSQSHTDICATCADICERCASDCEKMDGMEDCVKACRECAQSCRSMAGPQAKAA